MENQWSYSSGYDQDDNGDKPKINIVDGSNHLSSKLGFRSRHGHDDLKTNSIYTQSFSREN